MSNTNRFKMKVVASTSLAAALLLGGSTPVVAAPAPVSVNTAVTVTPASTVTVAAKRHGPYPKLTKAQGKALANTVKQTWRPEARVWFHVNNRLKGYCSGGASKYTWYYWYFYCNY